MVVEAPPHEHNDGRGYEDRRTPLRCGRPDLIDPSPTRADFLELTPSEEGLIMKLLPEKKIDLVVFSASRDLSAYIFKTMVAAARQEAQAPRKTSNAVTEVDGL